MGFPPVTLEELNLKSAEEATQLVCRYEIALMQLTHLEAEKLRTLNVETLLMALGVGVVGHMLVVGIPEDPEAQA